MGNKSNITFKNDLFCGKYEGEPQEVSQLPRKLTYSARRMESDDDENEDSGISKPE